MLAQKDKKGRERPMVEVLRGNPDIVADLGDSLKFKHKYRSAVISWADVDQPTAEQKQEVLDEFERLAFAGLDPDQYHFLAVDHGDHIHIISPRVELRSGKSMNIAAPGWQKVYDPLRDYFNEKYGWKSPDIDAHPENARLVNLSAHNIPKTVKKAKEAIHAAALSAIEDGLIENREDMESWLGDLGEVTRRGKDYISLKPSGFKKAMKFKGVVYERSWKAAGENKTEEKGRERSPAQDRERGAGYFYGELERIIDRRSIYNKKRYGYHKSRQQEGAGEVVGEAIAADIAAGERVHQGDRIGEEESQESLLGNHPNINSIDIVGDSGSVVRMATQAEPDGMEGASVGARPGGEVDLNRGSQQKGNTDRNYERERRLNDAVGKRVAASLGKAREELQIKLGSGNEQLRREYQKDSRSRRERLDKLDRASVQIDRAMRFYLDPKSVDTIRVAKGLRRRKSHRSVIAAVREIFERLGHSVKVDFAKAIAETIEKLAKAKRAKNKYLNRWGSGMKM